MMPETRYAIVGDVHVAYQTVGDGPVDLVLADQWFSHMEAQWDVPPVAELRRRLASIGRLIVFDKRGVGMSDPVAIDSLPSIEAWIDDLRAVLDAAGAGRAVLIATLAGTVMGLLFAATHPDRVQALVIVDGFARALAAPDYPAGQADEEFERRIDQVRSSWGRGLMLHAFAPGMRREPGLRDAWARYERFAASPGSAIAMVRNLYQLDARGVLPAIRVPTLVIQHADATGFHPDHGRYLAAHTDGAQYVELPGTDNLIWAGDQGQLVAEIEEFITGARSTAPADRRLATVLLTDIVGSTKHASELGDRAWRDLLARHDRLGSQAIEAAGGRVIKSTGDGILATFDGPGRGLRAAVELSRSAPRQLGIHIRAGLHSGEIELTGADVAGLAVHIAARVSALAGPDAILVTSTVRDLVVGSGFVFEPRGSRILKGVPGRWRLYEVSTRGASTISHEPDGPVGRG
jgi:class 3 adenylate cyclase